MSYWIWFLLMAASAFTGFMVGDIRACNRGGCVVHGKNWKVRAQAKCT